MATLFWYLNTVPRGKGGGTFFPKALNATTGEPVSPWRDNYRSVKHRTAARTLFHRPYLAHFCPVFSRFFAVFSVLTPGFQKVAPEDRGPVP